MTPDKILQRLERCGESEELFDSDECRAAAKLIRELMQDNERLRTTPSETETIHDRDVRAVVVACAPSDSEELSNGQLALIVRDAFRVGDAIAVERARRAKGSR